MLRAFLLAICLCVAAAAFAQPWEVVPLTGEPYRGTLVAADDRGFSVKSGEQTKQLKWSEVLRIGGFVDPTAGPLWLLGDGGQLVSTVESLADDQLSGVSPLVGTSTIPLGKLHGWLYVLPADIGRREELIEQVTRGTADNDTLILTNGDRLSGTLTKVSAEQVELELPSGASTLEIDRVAAVRLNPNLVDFGKPADRSWLVGLRDGTRLRGTSLSLANGKLRLSTASGQIEVPVAELAGIQPFVGQIQFISDLEPASYKHLPYLQLTWPLRRDANVLGQSLRAGNTVYIKGLGVHTAARVSYKLDKPYRQFQTELAVDDSAGGKGSAVCSVFVDDGSGKWQSRYTSPVIRGGMAPVPVRVDLSGVKAISLLADFADQADVLDHINWLDARLVN